MRNWVGGHIPALQQGKGCYFSTEKILRGELALYLLRLVAVSVPVEQVGVGGHLWGADGGKEGSRLGYLVKIKDQQAI